MKSPKGYSANLLTGSAAYAYTNTRIRVMKTKLLKELDFKKLMKMSLPEIARFLQESEYKSEINQLAMNYSGVNLLEYALNKNLENTCKKILNFSIKESKEQVRLYLQRWDVWSIKMVLRGKFAGASNREIISGLIAAGDLEREFLEAVVEKCTSVEEVIDNLKGTPYYAILVKYKDDLAVMEDELDKTYYKFAIKLAEPELKNFFKDEVDTINTLNSLRARKADVKLMLLEGGSGKLIKVSEKEDSIDARIAVKKQFVEKGLDMIKEYKRTVRPILGYFAAKENEINNLRMIVRGKHSNISQEMIEKQLVI